MQTELVGAVVPPLDDERAVAADTVAAFARDGHAVVRGLASPEEAAAFHPIIEAESIARAWNRGADQDPEGDPDSYEKLFLQAFNLWQVDPRIATFVLSRRFASVAAQLLGVERVRLYHDQSLCKGPGGGRTPWHQDQFFWPLDTDRTITMWMPMIDLAESMTFATGSHRLGDLRGAGISKEGDRTFAELIERKGLPTDTHGAVRAGDATFHGGWTLHSAGRNTTDRLRTVMTVIYFADGTRVTEQVTKAQEVDRVAWLGGRGLGELADHEGNPVLGR